MKHDGYEENISLPGGTEGFSAYSLIREICDGAQSSSQRSGDFLSSKFTGSFSWASPFCSLLVSVSIINCFKQMDSSNSNKIKQKKMHGL